MAELHPEIAAPREYLSAPCEGCQRRVKSVYLVGGVFVCVRCWEGDAAMSAPEQEPQ